MAVTQDTGITRLWRGSRRASRSRKSASPELPPKRRGTLDSRRPPNRWASRMAGQPAALTSGASRMLYQPGPGSGQQVLHENGSPGALTQTLPGSGQSGLGTPGQQVLQNLAVAVEIIDGRGLAARQPMAGQVPDHHGPLPRQSVADDVAIETAVVQVAMAEDAAAPGAVRGGEKDLDGDLFREAGQPPEPVAHPGQALPEVNAVIAAPGGHGRLNPGRCPQIQPRQGGQLRQVGIAVGDGDIHWMRGSSSPAT